MDDTVDPAEGPTSLAANESSSPIVSDIGCARARVGFAGSAAPDADFSSWSSSSSTTDTDSPIKFQVGTENLALPALNKELHPIVANGTIQNWDALEALWNHASASILNLDLSNKFVLMSESALADPSSRSKHAQLMFERFNVGGIFIAREAPLALYACARTTGVVLNVGQDYSCASPVREGYVLTPNIRKSMLGGQMLTERTLQLMKEAGVSVAPRYSFAKITTPDGVEQINRPATPARLSFERYWKLDVCRVLKESKCTVASRQVSIAHINQEPIDSSDTEEIDEIYELPDGTNVQLQSLLHGVAEPLFNPELLGSGGGTSVGGKVALPQLIRDAVNSIKNADSRNKMYSNIVICGGSTSFRGMTGRLREELAAVNKTLAMTANVVSAPREQRATCAWIGGSVLALLDEGVPDGMWVTKEMYAEHGAEIIEEKCP